MLRSVHSGYRADESALRRPQSPGLDSRLSVRGRDGIAAGHLNQINCIAADSSTSDLKN
jgi:hypothetical protein